MEVTQRFIDLLNLSVGALRKLAADLGVEFPAGTLKWDMARELSRATRETLEAETEGLHAGRTSLSWFRLVPEDEEIDDDTIAPFYPLAGEAAEIEGVRQALTDHAEGDPFDERDRPDEITSSPKLVVAHERDDGVIIMTFAVSKRAGYAIHNFESYEIVEDEFFNAAYRPADGTVEIRASAGRATKLGNTWLSEFAAELDLQPVRVAITPEDVRGLHDALEAKLDVYRGRDATGVSVFDTARFSKAETCEDLYDEAEFDEATEDLEPMDYDLLFAYDGFEQIRLHVSTFQGSVFVNATVPERIIVYVYETLREIKT